MSTGLDRREGGRKEKSFLSYHRCPEVELLPHYNSETKTPPLCSLAPAEKSSEFTCTGQSEANYPEIPSTSHHEEEEEESEEEGGSVSDWSEEDLSLHFSPSVILPSGDEESDPESSFECVDITVETQVKGQEREGLKMVPKRQIQLKKKDVESIINLEETEKPQVKLKDGTAEGGVANNEVSANDLLCPSLCRRPDFLLRQHSMPATLHTCSSTSSDVDSHSVYRGLVAGANQGFHLGGNSRQRLQKSFSLDETKTKMASSIIKSVLSKKMKVEQNNSKNSYLQKTPALPSPPQPTHQQGVREGGGGKTVHAVRDMRSLVKNPYIPSFSTAPSTHECNKPRSIKVIGQEESPPPTYQQAVGVKGHDETRRSYASVTSSGGNITKVDACFSQSQDRKPSNRFSFPITQQRQDSQQVINGIKVDDVTRPVMLDLLNDSTISSDLSERAGGMSQRAGPFPPASVFIQPPPHAPSISRHPKGTHPQEQSSILDVSSQFAPSSSQHILPSCFYTPTALAGSIPTPTLYSNMGKVSYVQRPLSFIQTQLQPFTAAPTLHLLRRSEENQIGSTRHTSKPLNCFIKTSPPQWTQTTGDQESNGNTVTPATQRQQELQKLQQQLQHQQFLCSVQGFLPAQEGSDFLTDVKGSAAASGALLTSHNPCHMMLNPKTGQCIYVNKHPQPQRKMLLDPETGQYVQVILPAVSCVNNTSVFPVHYANYNPIVTNHAPSTVNSNTSLLSVMRLQPMVPVSSLYTHPCLPSNPAHTIS